MSEDGYTLTETLAALAVIGMSFGGLTLGAQVIGSSQLTTSKVVRQVHSVRATQERLEQLLSQGAPFSSQSPGQLSGDAAQFQFQCGMAAPCAAQIAPANAGAGEALTVTSGGVPTVTEQVAIAGDARFVYRGAGGVSDIWPPAGQSQQALRSVAVVRATANGDVPVVDAKIWAEQPVACDFDPVAQDCR